MKRLSFLFLSTFFLSLSYAQINPEAELAEKYFNDGEFEPALELYQKIYKGENKENYALAIVSCLEQLQRYDEAVKFLQKTSKKQSGSAIYPIVLGLVYEKMGKMEDSEKLIDQTIQKKIDAPAQFIRVATYLYQNGKLEKALATYQQGRKKLKDNGMYSDEIANIYEQLGNYELATEEYLNTYYSSPSDENTVKMSILNMVNSVSTADIEKSLIRAVDKRSADPGLRKMLYEYYVLAENFEEAFIQVKSIDRLFNEEGNRIMEFATIMRNNKKYSLSNRAFSHIVNRKKNSSLLYQAQEGIAINGEAQAFETIPVDLEAVNSAAVAYKVLIDNFGRGPENFEAIYRYANLNVFYLNELDEALAILEDVSMRLHTRDQRSREKYARAKLLMGDIYLMKKDYNKSKLSFEEVSNLYRDRQLGALAKYKLAQLSYYKGEFKLSQALLSAIKDQTSNDISNDAIKLNLLIIDNTGLDTTTTALEMFAQAQLHTYQRDYDQSIAMMDSLSYKFPNHALADEIYWEKSNIFLKQNDIKGCLEFLEKILENFKQDIYGDDALYTKARIYDYNINDQEQAMKFYLEFLTSFPGSLYSVEVRKRIRQLRNEG